MELIPYTHVFSYIDTLKNPAANLISLGIELRNTPDYYYDNRSRNLDAWLFQYTLSGSGTVELDGTAQKLTPQKAMLLKLPSASKYYFSASEDEDWWFLYILIQGSALSPYYDYVTERAGNILSLPENCEVIKHIEDLIYTCKSGNLPDFYDASVSAYSFMNKMCRYFGSHSEDYSSRIRAVIRELNTEYQDFPGFSALAERHGITVHHLTREFKDEVGISPVKYLTNVRIAHAKNLLQSTNFSVEEISRQCGYTRANYFCRVFREATGVTPLKYRLG